MGDNLADHGDFDLGLSSILQERLEEVKRGPLLSRARLRTERTPLRESETILFGGYSAPKPQGFQDKSKKAEVKSERQTANPL
jgi:hypothetical protein